MLLSILGTLLAIGIPCLLWPIACQRIYRSIGLRDATAIGILSGPLWFGWLLGAMVLLFPGLPVWGYTIALVVVPLPALILPVLSVKVENEHPQSTVLVERVFIGVLLSVLVGFLIFNTLVFPPWDHDILVVQSFAARLQSSWNFWSLPRYGADPLGFYYPLAHPPAMMSVMAWMASFSPYSWVTRMPSAMLLGASFFSLYLAGEHLLRRSGYWVIVLMLSSGLYLFFVTNNSQDIFRFAGMAGALAVLPFAQQTYRSAILAGCMLGLSAAYHSLGLVFIVLLPGAFWLAHAFRWEATKKAAAMALSAAVIAFYPYLANYLHLGSLVIPTQVIVPIPNVIAFMGGVQDAYAQTQSVWDAWVSARLAMFTNYNTWGYAGLSFLAALLVFIVQFARRSTFPGAVIWGALIISSLGYLIVIIDPGDILYGLVRKRLIVNIRYPLAMLPVIALAGAVGIARLLGNKALVAVPVFLISTYFILLPTNQYFTLDKKIQFEDRSPCIFCSDHEKLFGNRDSGSYRAVNWLENLGDRRCLTFRESDYFAWSTKLQGVAFYNPVANHAFGITNATAVREYLLGEGVNCVFIDNTSVIRDEAAKVNPSFEAMGTLASVKPFHFYDINVWILDGQFDANSPVSVALPAREIQAFRFPITGVTMAEIELEFSALKPVNIVGYLAAANGNSHRVFIKQQAKPGTQKIAFVNDAKTEYFSFWFSDIVNVNRLTIRNIKAIIK